MNEPSNDAPPTITESTLDTVPEAERQRILTLGEKAWDATYRAPPVWVGPHGCDVCGHATVEGDFDPTEPCPECGTEYALDFRHVIKKAFARPGAPTKAAVAREVAQRWGVVPESAETALSDYIAGRRTIPPAAVAAVFDALGLTIRQLD